MRIGSGQMQPGGSNSRALIRVRNVYGDYFRNTAFGIKRIVFTSVEARTKATKVLSGETNAILFYATKIICQIYSDVTGEEDTSKLPEIGVATRYPFSQIL